MKVTDMTPFFLVTLPESIKFYFIFIIIIFLFKHYKRQDKMKDMHCVTCFLRSNNISTFVHFYSFFFFS